MAGEAKTAVYAALAGNLAIAVTKFGAAVATGSSSMLTESVHSLVDTCNQGLLLYGHKRSARPPDAVHPLGYGRELYFWSFVVALLVFAGGAGVSVYEGIQHVRRPVPIENPIVNFIVLGLSLLFEGGSWLYALRAFSLTKGSDSWWRAIRRSKDPSTLAVLFEDSAAMIGIGIAGLFISLALVTGDARLDGVGSILIGCVLALVAALLARESKGLLIGERASPELSRRIASLACQAPSVLAVSDVLTMHLAPDQVVVTMSVEFEDDLDTSRIERAVSDIEKRIESAISDVARVFVRPRAAKPPDPTAPPLDQAKLNEPEPRRGHGAV
ncbi:cation diffusion facilitator family transporter [Flavisphingomonas formosensis]|uniref:cation diffusion facilitator family transporter n=1 Tax=Flavisphingomonas formosensis TaxID=861534 RepID=UPI0012F97D38|nr:cation diffusion facilitator family transporter [Sphingomonas formosensis]